MKKLYFLPILFFLLSTQLIAQNCDSDHLWERTNPGGGGWFGCVGVSSNGVILAGSDLSGAYRSFDGGQTWDICGDSRGYTETHVSAMGFHRTNHEIMFLAGDSGIYKSSDTGDSWSLVLDTGNSAPQRGYVTDIEFGTDQPNTGYAAWHGGNWNTDNADILKTVDGGDTWNRLNSNLPDTRITKLLVNPLDINTIYVLTGKGRPICTEADVYKSSDGGLTWQNMTLTQTFEGFTEVVDIALDPQNPETLYITTVNANCNNQHYYVGRDSKFFKSTDEGNTWIKLQDQGGIIFVDENNSSKITLIETRIVADWNPNSGTRVSLDGGNTFTKTSNVATWGTAFHGITQYTYGGTRDGYNRTIAQDPSNPDTFFWVNSQWVAGSTNGGETFNVLHGNEVSAGSWQSTGADNIVNYEVTLNESNPNIIYLGLADMGIWRSLDKGGTWESCNTESIDYGWGQGRGGNVRSILSDPSRQNVVWTAVQKGYVLKSTDTGQADSWFEANAGLPAGAYINGLSIDVNSPENNRTLYLTANGTVYKSIDDGESWSSLLTDASCNFTAVDRINSNIVYAGGTKGLWQSSDQGITWTRQTSLQDLPADNSLLNIRSNSYRGIYDIQTDPNVENRLYITVFGGGQTRGLHRSDDAGVTWEKILEDSYMRQVAIAPKNSNILYATSSSAMASGGLKPGSNGIWFSDDAGENWTIQNQDMSYPFANAVAITNENEPTVIVGSQGSGFQTSAVPIQTVTANCQSLTIALDNSGSASITPDQVNNNSVASCDIDTITLDISDFSCDDIGVNTVVLTVTDINGNISSCDATITIEDINEPEITSCAQDRTETIPTGTLFTIPDYTSEISATDNCSTSPIFTQSPVAGTTVTVGTTTSIILSAADSAGNSTSCSFTLTIDESLSVNDSELTTQWMFYPNPTSDLLHIDYSGYAAIRSIAVFDLQGRIVRNMKSTSLENLISMKGLSTNIYFVKITTSLGSIVKRIVVKN